jgi:hypothetical protein
MSVELLKAQIVKRLAAGESPKNIIYDLCEKYKMRWDQAEALVNSTQNYHAEEITKQQAPLIAILSLAIFVGGVGLFLYSIYAISNYVTALTQPTQDPLEMADLIYHIVRYAPGYLVSLVTGLGMTGGGAMGMKPLWEMILPKK